jgi:anti-anti-sigma factor
MTPLDPDGSAKIVIERSIDRVGNPVLSLTGELDLSNINRLRPELKMVTAMKPALLTIDLNGLSFMDSSGIALLVEAAQDVGSLEIQNPSVLIRRVLEATGVSQILHCKP